MNFIILFFFFRIKLQSEIESNASASKQKSVFEAKKSFYSASCWFFFVWAEHEFFPNTVMCDSAKLIWNTIDDDTIAWLFVWLHEYCAKVKLHIDKQPASTYGCVDCLINFGQRLDGWWHNNFRLKSEIGSKCDWEWVLIL